MGEPGDRVHRHVDHLALDALKVLPPLAAWTLPPIAGRSRSPWRCRPGSQCSEPCEVQSALGKRDADAGRGLMV